MVYVLRVVGGLLELLAGARAEPKARTVMPEVTSRFELRQLLKAYRRGLISDEVFEEQLREIQLDGSAAAPAARCYRAGERSFATEREMVLHFLDEFRAGETFGGEVFALWSAVASDPCVRGGLEVVREREAMHGRLLAARITTLGGQCRASLPEKFQLAARTRLGARDVADRDKVADFVRRLPDVDAAVAPIREVIAQIESDLETRALLESILEDEIATVRWFHSLAKPAPSAVRAAEGNGSARL
jgi:ferritin-like protein